MTKKILLGMGAGLVVFCIVVLLLPSEFAITRYETMRAPASEIFVQINDLRRWKQWSPWEKMDPGMVSKYDGPPEGIGASHAWSGNNQVGEGKMTITKNDVPTYVQLRLEFFRPMKATNMAEFKLTPNGENTRVTWTMTGKNNFIGKIFCLFMNMDKLVGADFEKGLLAMKGIVERPVPQ